MTTPAGSATSATPATVAGRALSDWSRDGRFGTWHALLPGPADDPPLGVLRIDRALLAPEGARSRLAAAVVAVAKLRLPGVPATVDLVEEAGDVWLIVARPPSPTVADVLTANRAQADAGSAASILNETAQTLLALHAAGLAHGALTSDNVVLAPDGTALLAEVALSTALSGTPTASACHDDITAWAALARRLGNAWTAVGTEAADLFARCSGTAESDGLGAARATLVSGRAALPADFLRRTALRAAAAAALTDLTVSPAHRDTPGRDATGPHVTGGGAAGSEAVGPKAAGRGAMGADASDRGEAPPPEATGRTVVNREAPGPVTPGSEAPGPEAKHGEPGDREPGDRAATSPAATAIEATGLDTTDPAATGTEGTDLEATVLGRRGRASRSAAATDEQATVLGKRNRRPGSSPASAPAGVGDRDILLRFGPGVPRGEQESLRAAWPVAAPVPGRRRLRRRRVGRLGAAAVLTALAVVLWLLLRPTSGPTVATVEVKAPTQRLSCGQTADLIGVMTTDGSGGPITYRWLRSDGQESGELTRTVRRGDHKVTVHLQWTVRGPGLFRGTARLQVLGPAGSPIEGEGTFSYSCV
ncbi:hypothetical protein [Streptomyces sp. NPDC001774]